MPGAINHWLRPVGSELRRLLEERYSFAAGVVRGQVLDWACGYGLGTSMLALAPAVVSVHGLDVDPEAVRYARGAVRHRAATFDCGDIETAELPAADWLVCCETLEHLTDPAAFLRRAQEQLRGIVLSVPIWPTVGRGNKEHRHDFTTDQIAALFPTWQPLVALTLQEHSGDRVVMEYLLGAWRR